MRFRCLAIALALLAAFSSDSRGQSKQPPAQSKQSTQPSVPDQRGTDQVPLTVKILPAQDAEKQTEKAERDRKEKAIIDEKLAFETQRIADYTDRLALFTVLLFIVAISQAGLFVWQLLEMKGAGRDTKSAAEASLKQANAIIDAERPYVFFKITHPGLVAQNERLIPDIETKGRLHFELINAGKTPAMLDEFKELYPVIEGITDAPTPLDPMKDRGRLLPIGTISTASSPFSRATNLFNEETVPEIRKMLTPMASEQRRIFFQGFVRYFDAFGNHYITGFLAAYSPLHSAWALRGGKEYNYSRQERREDIPPHPDYPGED